MVEEAQQLTLTNFEQSFEGHLILLSKKVILLGIVFSLYFEITIIYVAQLNLIKWTHLINVKRK